MIMYSPGLIINVLITAVLGKHHVIKLTQHLIEGGYNGNIDLGEVIAEAVVDSQAACGKMCAKNSACNSVLLMEGLCQLLSASYCQVNKMRVMNVLMDIFGSSTT